MAESESGEPENIFEQFESSELTQRTWKDQLSGWIEASVASMRIIWQDYRTRIGLFILAFYLLMGTVGVIIVAEPHTYEGGELVGAFQTAEFPLGTDHIGQDLLKLTVHATPAMLKMMIAGGVATTAVGALVGLTAGYKRGNVERVLMTAADSQMAIPGLPLLIVLAVALQPEDPFVVGLLLSVDAWAGLARQVHSQVLSTRNEDYVEASRALGLGSPAIIRDDILPNIMPFIMIRFMGNTVRVINASVGLYFIGVLPFTTQNWGVMLNQGWFNVSLSSWAGANAILVPMLVIVLINYGTILFSQGMDRLFNPRIRARHSDAASSDAAPAEG